MNFYRQPACLAFASSEVESRFQQQPGQFYVACGLALQALQRAAISTDLLPGPKSGVLGMLRINLRERSTRSAWGLDLSGTGLKAIQLTIDEDDQLCVTNCLHVAHRQSVPSATIAATGSEILRESLNTFLSHHTIAATDRVATQWPSIDSLVRFVTIPPASGKKLKDLIQQEARHQIPFPLHEVCWNTCVVF